MPGLSQLKKFNADILSLGNEPALRAARGEKPVTVPVPKSIKDFDDSDDFVMGMPEPVENPNANKPVESGPEDFSDIMGTGGASESAEASAAAPQINLSVPDLSSLAAFDTGMAGEPDLSMFEEPVQEEEPEPEPEEEKEPEIADLSLEDLLGGAGFDGSQGEEELTENAESEEELEEIPGDAEAVLDAEPVSEEVVENLTEADAAPESLEDAEPFDFAMPEGSLEDAGTAPVPDSFDIPEIPDVPEVSETPGAAEPAQDSFDIPEMPEAADITDIPEAPLTDESTDAAEPLEVQDDSFLQSDDASLENPDNNEELKTSDFGDIAGINLDAPDFGSDVAQEESFEAPSDIPAETSLETSVEAPAGDFEKISPEAQEVNDEFAFDGNAIDMGSEVPAEDAGAEDNFGMPDGLFNAADFELPEMSESGSSESLELSDSSDSLEAADSSDFAAETPADIPEAGSEITDNIEMPEITESSGASDASEPDSGFDAGGSDDFPSDFNFNLDDSADEGDSGAEVPVDESAPMETFDTSAMEGLDFGIPDTDAALEKGNFELGNSDDFASENMDFEIPGFSDVETVEVNKNGKIKVPVQEEEQPQEETSDLPPNTLSDEQYEKFIKNLSGYPLNVRMAVEELIVKNEFTDEAEFGIIQKVLKKASARQLASELEKMLDIAIPVPRDFERRTAEEYEAYKASFQYQLSNKIIPGAIISLCALVICFFMFQFVKFFIYKPARANSLYSQGYRLLELEDFPQSEIKFTEATKYNLNKKWFFRYAHGYREHRQYIRAEQMYKNILYCFKFDKTAGLEYAEMQLYDLANYEKAEQILLRDVLDHHINDADGILLLGDTYLEWAEEKDPEKFEEAHKRYAELIQLYGQTDRYMARMMRYHIRTDNLREVLNSKERFYPRPKSLEAKDWTELSGYCLDKLYGPLSPSDEYLRTKIENVKEMLVRAVKANGKDPVSHYNLARYYINTNNSANAERSLVNCLNAFEKANVIRKKDLYKNIDGYRLLGELYTNDRDYLKAMEAYTGGITLFNNARTGSGLEGTSQVGNLFADMGDIEYFIAGDYDNALRDYQEAVDINYDNGQIRYKIGYIQYSKSNFAEAVGSFMKASEDYADDQNLLYAMGNTLSLRNDNYAAQGYYERLLEQIDSYREQHGILFPQVKKNESEIVESYLKASNNLGVTMYRLARRTGSSAMNARAMVKFQDSLRAWDSMTRNQQSMVRLGGSNLAEQNLKYVTHPMPDYEPAIYTDLSRTLSVEKGLMQ